MDKKWDSGVRTNVLAGAAIAVVGVATYFFFQNYSSIWGGVLRVVNVLQPFIFGAVFAFLINLPMVFIENRLCRLAGKGKEAKPVTAGRKKGIRGISILLAMLLVLMLIGLFLYAIMPQLLASVNTFIANIKNYIIELDRFIDTVAQTLHIDRAVIDGFVPTFDELINNLVDFFTNSVNRVVSVTSQITSVVINAVIGLIISVYLLFSKEVFIAQAKKLLYALVPRKWADSAIRVSTMTNRTFTGFVSGKMIDSLIIGIICFVGLTAMKMPYALLISVIIGVTNIIPFFGPIFGAIPSTLIVLLVDPLKALLLVIFIVILQQFDGNILGPRILGDSTGLPTFWVMFSIIVGGGIFGFVGMLISVPVFAVIYSLVKDVINARLAARGMPSPTDCYDRPGVYHDKTPPKEQDEETKAAEVK